MVLILILPIIAYLLGSINPAVWVSKRFYNMDIREHGSKNAGATNVLRVLGPKAALPVFAFDILKGFLAVSLFYLARTQHLGNNIADAYKIFLAASVVLGHIFPVFSGFKGGKGVSTILGAAIAIEPAAAGIAALVFVVVFFSFRYVSLGSMLAGISFSLVICHLLPDESLTMRLFSICVAIMLLITHRKNISRLMAGTESKISLKKKV